MTDDFSGSKLWRTKNKKYDLIIIGAGPAGLSAFVCASRYKINHLVIGQIFDSSLFKSYLVENYPGFEKIKGADLIQKFYDQAKNLGAEIISEETVDISKNSSCPSLVKGEISEKGVSYCAVCDTAFLKIKKQLSLKSFYAVGDITTGSNGLRQVVTAVSEGAVAAMGIYGELKKEN